MKPPPIPHFKVVATGRRNPGVARGATSALGRLRVVDMSFIRHHEPSPYDKAREREAVEAGIHERLLREGDAAAAKGAQALRGWMETLDGDHTARVTVRMGQRWRAIVQSLTGAR